VFCVGKEDHGDCPDLVMELNLTDNVPVVVAHRQIPHPLYEEVKNFLNDLIANNWVCESKSSYSSPIVCVRKKDGGLRLCIDYRALNKKVVPDKQPIPRIQEIFDGLGGQEYCSTLDHSVQGGSNPTDENATPPCNVNPTVYFDISTPHW
jgi:hypothetical protein